MVQAHAYLYVQQHLSTGGPIWSSLNASTAAMPQQLNSVLIYADYAQV